MLIGVDPIFLLRLFLRLATTDFPGRMFLAWFIGLRLSATAFLWNCQRQMQKKFR
jgi:hypothetical protein